MAKSEDKAATIRGVRIPPRRYTRWAALYFVLFFVLPILTLCFLIDLLLYTLFTDWLGRCYALLCLLE